MAGAAQPRRLQLHGQVTTMGVSALAPAACILALALRAILPPRHPALLLLLIGGCIVGAVTAAQPWAQAGWGAVGLACLVAWMLLARPSGGAQAGDAGRSTGAP